MAPETVDYTVVLADLEAQRAAIDAAIAGVRRMLNLGAEPGAVSSATGVKKDEPAEVRSDSFFRMSMPDAITKFLSMAKRPQSVSEITQALQDGGFPTTAKNLMPSVGSTLSRMKGAGDVVSVQGKWGLSSWYPGMRKEKPEPGAKAKKGRKPGRPKRSRAKTAKPSAEAKPSDPQAQSQHSVVGKPKLTQEQVEQIRVLRAGGKSQAKVAKQFSVSRGAVWGITSGRTWKSAGANGKVGPDTAETAHD